jgi:hypothetical protein
MNHTYIPFTMIIAVVIIIIIIVYMLQKKQELFKVILGSRSTLHYPKIFDLKIFFDFIDYFMTHYKDIDIVTIQKTFILDNIENIMNILNYIVYNEEYNYYKIMMANSYDESYYLYNDEKYNYTKNLLIYNHFNKSNISINLQTLKDIIDLTNTNDINVFSDIYNQTDVDNFYIFFIEPIKSMIKSIISIGSSEYYIRYMREFKK